MFHSPSMTKIKIAFVANVLVAACQQANSADTLKSVEPSRAKSASDFVGSIGVNTHLGYLDTSYGDFAKVKKDLKYLGIQHVRDGLEDDVDSDNLVVKRFRKLHQSGIKITGIVPYETNDMDALISQIRKQGDVLEAVEGPNETDIFTEFSYRGEDFPEGTIAFMKDFYPAIKADSQLSRLKVLQTTLAFPEGEEAGETNADLLGDLSDYADYGNSHNYFDFGEVPSRRIEEKHLPLNQKITPRKPMMSSEGGYQMGESDGYKGEYDDGLSARFSEDVHGRYLLRYVLEQYRLGYQRSFIYELMSIDQPQWGLFRKNGTPRPAATGIRNMIKILSETERNDSSRIGESKSISHSLDYTLENVPPSVHSLLLQKSDGKFYLMMWNEVRNWDANAGKPIETEPVPISLVFHQPIGRVRTFLPLTDGVKATAESDERQIEVDVPDHPLIVEVSPG
jgi:hypothetical protein